MQRSIPYGGSTVSVSIPDTVSVARFVPPQADNADSRQILQRALNNPLGAPSLEQFVAGARSILVVVNDATRPTPTAQLLDHILPALSAVPEWTIITATGLHRAPTEPEIRGILGSHCDSTRARFLIHDGRDTATLVRIGKGEKSVLLNRRLINADRVIVLTSVEPHSFAGYSGGRKSLVPGLAGADTVERSHAGAMSPLALPLNLDGNPVREYIVRASAVIPSARLWSVQVVQDSHGQIAGAFAGDIDASFVAAAGMARRYYAVPVPRLYDVIIVAVGPPLDLNLYQAQKGWEGVAAAVRDGGVVIVASECAEGIGSRFYEDLVRRHPNPDDWPALADWPYTLGLHKLVRMGRARKRFRLCLASGLTAQQVAPFGYEPFAQLQDAVDAALSHVGRASSHLAIVENGALTTLVPPTSAFVS